MVSRALFEQQQALPTQAPMQGPAEQIMQMVASGQVTEAQAMQLMQQQMQPPTGLMGGADADRMLQPRQETGPMPQQEPDPYSRPQPGPAQGPPRYPGHLPFEQKEYGPGRFAPMRPGDMERFR